MKRGRYPKNCIYCGERDFEQEYEDDGEEVHERRTCNQCGRAWTLVYEFVEYVHGED